MAIKLALMKTGQYVISDIREILSNKEKVCGYMLNYPQTVTYNNSSLLLVEQKLDNSNESREREIEVTLSPWIPITSDNSIPVTLESVIALVNPLESLESLFNQKIELSGHSIEKTQEEEWIWVSK